MLLHDVLSKHGFEHKGRGTYGHTGISGHKVTAGENGKSWSHSDTANKFTTGYGHEALDNHLTSIKGQTHSHKVGDTVHLGFGAKGGAGFIGKVTHIDDRHTHIKNDAGKTYKGPHKFVSQHTEEVEQFGESYHDIIAKHGYTKQREDGVATRYLNGDHSVMAHHPSDDNKTQRWVHVKGIKKTEGYDAESLHKHLANIHQSQHTEEEEPELELGHVSADRARELCENRPELWRR